jgi:hypothetical protein
MAIDRSSQTWPDTVEVSDETLYLLTDRETFETFLEWDGIAWEGTWGLISGMVGSKMITEFQGNLKAPIRTALYLVEARHVSA